MDLRKIEDVKEDSVNTGGEGNVREEKNTKGEESLSSNEHEAKGEGDSEENHLSSCQWIEPVFRSVSAPGAVYLLHKLTRLSAC